MYSTCLHCTRDLGTNDMIETLPIGRRIAFDPAQGRLWVVCRSCAKWNLVPFDTRLESIDACERLFSDTKTRFSTDNIGLARMADGLDLVRIGAPQLPEFASWRYGEQYRRRRRKNIAIWGTGFVGIAVLPALATPFLGQVAGTATALVGMTPMILSLGFQAILARQADVVALVPGRPGTTRLGVTATHGMHIAIRDDRLILMLPLGVLDGMKNRHATVEGPDARLLARRLLAALNRNVGSSRHIADAVNQLADGETGAWLRRLEREALPMELTPYVPRLRNLVFGSASNFRFPGVATGLRLFGLGASDRLAVEMWLSEEDEAKALAGELSLLERQWKEAEQIARIADTLAIPEGQS